MYLSSRVQAGRMLASQLAEKYQDDDCAVVALDDGGAMVGVQIASRLHCVLSLLMTSEITLPREPTAIAGITSSGTVSYNHSFSDGEINEMAGENFGYIEQQKLLKMHDLNRLVGQGGTINKELLRGRSVIVVSDGVKTGFLIDLACEFLKPINIKKLVFAIPLSSVEAVDRMHVLADDLYCLDVIGDYRETEHYYNKQDVPDHATILETIETITKNWK
jgi:putative phosphoribosyl transferase